LGSDNLLNLFRRKTVSLGDAPNLLRFCGIDNQHPVDQVIKAGLEQQWNDNDAVGRIQTCDLSFGFLADERVQRVLELLSGRGIGKDVLTKTTTVDSTVLVKHTPTKKLYHRVVSRFAGFSKCPRDSIGVNDRDAQLGEAAGDNGFTAADSAG